MIFKAPTSIYFITILNTLICSYTFTKNLYCELFKIKSVNKNEINR